MSSTVQIFCSADNYVDRYSSSGTHGSETILKLNGYNNAGGLLQYYPFFKFDLSSIPKNKSIKAMTLIFKVLTITDEHYTEYRPYYNTALPYVIKSRRVYDYTDIENLSAPIVKAASGANNIIGVADDVNDVSVNISADAGNLVAITIKDITRLDSDEVVVALRMDSNYINDRMVFCTTTISSRTGSVMPYLLVDYDDYVPSAPTNLAPNIATRNAAGAIKLSWEFADALAGTSQANYEVMYSKDGFATSTTATGTTASNYTIPANTFTLGNTVQWKVRITDTNGDVSAWSSIATITIGATLPSSPNPISPSSTIVNSSDAIYFRWKFVDVYGYSQAKYDLEYRKGTGTATVVSATSVNNYHALNAKTIVGGDYSWRVRCYNAFNEVGAYSAWTSFYSIGQPDLPSITSISNSMHPLVNWTSTEQDLYIIKIYSGNTVIFNSGEQASGSINEYAIPDFIENGTYKLGLQISNVYGLWSAEVFSNFTISAAKPSKPSMAGSVNDLYIALIITSTTATNLVYRKGSKDSNYKLITAMDNSNFLDYSALAGANQYFVRAITSTGFNDSDIISMNLSFNGIVLSGDTNNSEMINLWKTKDNDKRKSIALSKTQYKVTCNGRVYPLLQSTENKNQIETHEYFFYPGDYDMFTGIISNYNAVLYRNNYGYSFNAEISNVTIQEDVFGYIVSFTLTRLEE